MSVIAEVVVAGSASRAFASSGGEVSILGTGMPSPGWRSIIFHASLFARM